MKRIKKLGLTVLAVFALMTTFGVATSSAAGGFEADKYPVVVHGTQLESWKVSFNNNPSWTCNGFGFVAELKQRSRTLGQVMEGAKCENSPLGSGTFALNSCAFEFIPGDAGTGAGELRVGPSGCGAMTFTFKEGVCVYSIAPQSGASVTFENKEGDIIVSAAEAAFKYTRTKGTLLQCGAETAFAKITAKWQVSAENQEGVGVDIRAFGPYTIGLFLSGKQSEKESEQPKIQAEEYPVNVTGPQSAGNPIAWTTAVGTIKCEEITFSAGTLSGTTKSLSLSAQYGEGEYGGCTFTSSGGGTYAAAILMNSCYHQLGVLNVGPPYAGSFGIACTKEGDGIELIVETQNWKKETAFCYYKVSPQTSEKNAGLENLGSGYERKIAISFSAVPIAMKRTSGTLLSCGAENQTSKYSGGVTLAGTA